MVDTVLDQARLLSSILNTVADGPLNVPLLKGVAGLAERIITVIQTVRSNKADCLNLSQKIYEHLNLIATTYHPPLSGIVAVADDTVCTDVDALRVHIESLYKRLETVVAVVEGLSARSRWRRTLCHEGDKRKIAACKDDMQHIFMQFQLGATLVSSKETQQLRNDIAHLRLIVQSDMYHHKHRQKATDQRLFMIGIGVLFA